MTAWSQEDNEEKVIRDFGATIETNYFQPIYYGDNFISEGYDFNGGFNLGLTNSFSSGITLHFNFSFIEGDVTAPELVGDIRNSSFNRLFLGIGYPLFIGNKFYFVPSLNLGLIWLRHRQNFNDDRVVDNGTFIAIRASINYKLTEWLHLNLSAINHFDFLAIDTAPQDESFFDSASSIFPSIGLRFKIN